jgi:hypothetical protein
MIWRQIVYIMKILPKLLQVVPLLLLSEIYAGKMDQDLFLTVYYGYNIRLLEYIT